MIQGHEMKGQGTPRKKENQDSTKGLALRSDTVVKWNTSRQSIWGRQGWILGPPPPPSPAQSRGTQSSSLGTMKWHSMKWGLTAPGLPTHPPDGSTPLLIHPSHSVWLLPETSLSPPFFLTYKKPYIINIYNLRVLKISIHPWNRHHNLCHKHCPSPLKVSSRPFINMYIYNVIRTFNVRSTLLSNV